MDKRIEKSVFLSYRRTNFAWANAIYQNLTADGFDVFFDVKGIASGDFERVIVENIRARAHFLVILTPSALERCGEPGDWLRLEIEVALESRRNIVPVMFDGFNFQSPAIANQLTGKLVAIKSYNALPVPSEYFDEGMERLRRKYLNVPLKAVLHPSSAAAKQGAAEQRKVADAAPKVSNNELTAQQFFERALVTSDSGEKIRLYSEAIQLKPDYASAFNNRGVTRIGQFRYIDAIKDFDEAIRLKPDFALAFRNRSAARTRRKDYDGASKDIVEAIRLDPTNAQAICVRGLSRQKQGDRAGAMEDFDEAIRLDPDFPEALSFRSAARKRLGDLSGAEEDLERARHLTKAAYGLL